MAAAATSHSSPPSDNEMHIHLKAGGWQFNAATAEETRASSPSFVLPASSSSSSLWKSSQVKGGDHACRGERTEL